MPISTDHPTLHNVLFGQYVYLTTEQAETYFKICFLICHLTYISEGIIYYSVALPAMCAAVVQIWRTCNVTGGGAWLKVFLSADPVSMSNSYSFQKSSFHLCNGACVVNEDPDDDMSGNDNVITPLLRTFHKMKQTS